MGPVVRLEGALRPYAWGSRRYLAELTGRAVPAPGPEAELWFGAHPSAPSPAWLDDGSCVPLDQLLAAEPGHWLGAEVHADFGARLPFLVKLLAAAEPLSLQAHPTTDQARAGFEREEAAGLPRDARERSYPDPWAKPELLLALTPVDALCGFRTPARLRDLLAALEVAALDWIGDAADDPAAVVARLLGEDRASTTELVGVVGRAGARLAAGTHHLAVDGAWIAALAERYPGDPGVLVALLLQLVRLRPGQAIHVPAGRLHAYLRGAGVEVMASSDNVLRGGLTPKHVDVEELLRVLDPAGGPGELVGTLPGPAGERVRPTPTAAFRLSELELPAKGDVGLDRRGPDVLLVLDGDVEVVADGRTCAIGRGQAALVAATATNVRIAGRGRLARATTGPR